MTGLHPTFAIRDTALRTYCRARGIAVGDTSSCRTLAQQIRLRIEKPHLAANPYSIGGVSPWGWRIAGSLHMEQDDGYCHAIDYTLAGTTWSKFHAIAAGFGIIFPIADRATYPEPWHGQFWTPARGIVDAPMVGRTAPAALGDLSQPAPKKRTAQEAEMWVYEPVARGDGKTLDFTHLPNEGIGYGLMNGCKLYVRRPAAMAAPEHVRIYQAGAALGTAEGADAEGWFWLPDDGSTIEVKVARPGFVSVEGRTAYPIAEAQFVSYYTG